MPGFSSVDFVFNSVVLLFRFLLLIMIIIGSCLLCGCCAVWTLNYFVMM